MKKLLVVILTIVATINLKGQTNYMNVCRDNSNTWHDFDFNSPADSTFFYFYFDNTQVNNIWQVGTPNKTIFISGYHNTRALVTDTVNSYPINNISSFQFSLINCAWNNTYPPYWGNYHGPGINIVHRIETDSGIDGGTIEVSHNNGITWINLIQDTISSPSIVIGSIYTLTDTVASLGKPGFSGSAGWSNIGINYSPSWFFDTFDTITLRFTFASDSIQTNKDGWMIGLVAINGNYEGIEEIENDNLISIYPNPVQVQLSIKINQIRNSPTIQILNYQGQVIYDNKDFHDNFINIEHLTNGLYFLRYSDTKEFAIKKIVVNR